MLKAPKRLTPASMYKNYKKIFLAGSIDMGKAEDWQTRLTNEILNGDYDNVAIFNPRRDDWDSSWEQSIKNKQFREQVEWELDHLDRADLIVVYFDPKGQAPITLMELGLHAEEDIVVCCPDGFWRKGNVEIVCDRFGIPLVDNIDSLIDYVHEALESYLERCSA